MTDSKMDEPLARFEITEVVAGQTKWLLSVFPDRMVFRDEKDDLALEIERDDLPDKLEIFDGLLFTRRTIKVQLGRKPLFKLDPDVYEVLTRWIDPSMTKYLKIELKRRFSWTVALGAFLVFVSLPISGELVLGIEAIPLDLNLCLLGSTLIAMAILSRLKPHRVFFILDSFCLLALIVDDYLNLHTGLSWSDILFFLAMLWHIFYGIKQHRRFLGVSATDALGTQRHPQEHPHDHPDH